MPSVAREIDLGPPVIAWLEDQHFDVYQEVMINGWVADIVAVSSRLTVVVELKVSLSWDLLSQAIRWKRQAHLVWVAVPYSSKTGDGRRMAERVFSDHGIGIMEVRTWSSGSDILVRQTPTLFRRAAPVAETRALLKPEHKTFAQAGTSEGGHWTPFKGTCRDLVAHVREHPGVSMADAIKAIKHHYSSDAGARAHLASLIESGVVKGIRLERYGKSRVLFPA